MQQMETVPVAQIAAAACSGTLHHALILSGEGDLTPAARYAAAAYQCTASVSRPCLACAACRKVLRDIHPDVRTVRDEAHKMLSLETVRAVRSDAAILPNEGLRKVYIFDDCARLDARGQDVLLKVVEEGPPYAAFLFLTESAALLLPTLRSRCVEVKVNGAAAKEETAAAAEELCGLLASGDRGAVTAHLLRLSAGKMKREELMELLLQSRELLVRALLLRCGDAREEPPLVRRLAEGLSPKQLMRSAELLQKRLQDCEFNAGVGLLLGALAVEWEDIL